MKRKDSIVKLHHNCTSHLKKLGVLPMTNLVGSYAGKIWGFGTIQGAVTILTGGR